jgi:hypothetical protein
VKNKFLGGSCMCQKKGLVFSQALSVNALGAYFCAKTVFAAILPKMSALPKAVPVM